MKNVLLIVSGSIAAYKAVDLASALTKAGVDVNTILTKNAAEIIGPVAFDSITKNRCVTDTFDRNFEFKIGHISLAQAADLCIVAPATANIIGKMANGIADDMATTTIMALKCPVIVAPAMNTAMYENPIVQDNIKKLKDYGYEFIDPASGVLACGDEGKGKLAKVEDLFEAVMLHIAHEHDMEGQRVLVTAGATAEAIDPVRFITNHSTGKMGYALARAAARRGAIVTLVTARATVAVPYGVDVISTDTAAQMSEAVKATAADQDILVLAAAVADYRPTRVADKKLKKDGGIPEIELEKTEDILDYLGHHRSGGEFLCGFAMETDNLIENARAKLERKNADMICANSLRQEGAGFGTDTNVVTLISADGTLALPSLSKAAAADAIFDEILKRKKNGGKK